jgi:hypothetical protein
VPRPDAEGAEIHPIERLEELAADAGGEEVVQALVGEDDPGRGVANERVVDSSVGEGAGKAGPAGGVLDERVDPWVA